MYASPAIERVLGYTIEEVLGEGWWQNVKAPDPQGRTAHRRLLSQVAKGEVPPHAKPYSTVLYTSAGEERCILWHDAKGPGDLLIGSGQDITDLRRVEEEAEHRSQDFRAIFERASDGMLIADENWNYVDANPAAFRIFGLDHANIVGRQHGSLLRSGVNVPALRAKALALGIVTDETEFVRPDGQTRQVQYSIISSFRLGHHLIVMRDITDRRALELQLAQAQKLEAVGRLAGGVAHDFNNMLSAIRGYADLLLRKFPEGGHRRYVEGILKASDKAALTTQQLLAFSRRQIMQPKLLDLNQAVAETTSLIRSVIGEDIELITLASPDTGKVMVDPGQFSRMLMNLAINSRDAMPGGGKLIIETRSVFLDDEYVLKHIQVQRGHFAILSVTDTGTGIPPEIRAHIFEPFFTTKPQGEGTGLGLASVYGIVKQSGGYVWVYSEPGEGTIFKIYLPSVIDEKPKEAMSQAQGKTILLIEDDELIRSLAAAALRENRHVVWEATDGGEALNLCQKASVPIDLVITDVTAPGMSGEDLMGYFAVKYPQVPILHMSGFPKSHLITAHSVSSDSHFLAKPFTAQQLIGKVQATLERTQESPPEQSPAR